MITVACLLVYVAFVPSAHATTINITPLEPDKSRLAVLLTEITPAEDRVYTLDPEVGEITFGDGVSGSRLPTGGNNVVATYRYGAGGIGGEIVNIYSLSQDLLPFLIPFSDFVGTSNQEDVSFIIAGAASLNFEFSARGMLIVAAEPSAIPEPTTLILLAVGFAGIGFGRYKVVWNVRRLPEKTPP